MFLLFQVRHFTIKPINVKKKRKMSIGVIHVYFDHESMTLKMELYTTWEFRWRFSCKTQLSQRLPEVAF